MSSAGSMVSSAVQGVTKSAKDPLSLLNPVTAMQTGGLFGKSPSELLSGPDLPTPGQPVAAPTDQQAQDSAAETIRRRLNAKGRGSTLLTGGAGLTSQTGSIGKKTLLGQ